MRKTVVFQIACAEKRREHFVNIVKYPGGKEKELDTIRQYAPSTIHRYYEPFVGGGSVYLGIHAEHYFINDISTDLINLYQCVASQDNDFFCFMDIVNRAWKSLETYSLAECTAKDGLFAIYQQYLHDDITDEQLCVVIPHHLNSRHTEFLAMIQTLECENPMFFCEELNRTFLSKFKRMKVLEHTRKHISDDDIKQNIEGCFKASFYMYMRYLYNHKETYGKGKQAFLYLFIRDMCYSSMFRFNANGEYNVPYGGISYNCKHYDSTIVKYHDKELLEHLSHTTIECMDYRAFLQTHPPCATDFIFLDPPYDSEFSTYDQRPFAAEHQIKLAQYLIQECPCRFMLDIKYTPFIASLYREGTICHNGGTLHTVFFDKKYSVSFMNRNPKDAEHVLIMNYNNDVSDDVLIFDFSV